MGRVCVVPSCQAKQGEVRLHRFPKDPQRARIWCRAIQRPDLEADLAGLPFKKSVCDKHFSREQTFPMNRNRTNLKADAVPDHDLPDCKRMDSEEMNKQRPADVSAVSSVADASPKNQKLSVVKLEENTEAVERTAFLENSEVSSLFSKRSEFVENEKAFSISPKYLEIIEALPPSSKTPVIIEVQGASPKILETFEVSSLCPGIPKIIEVPYTSSRTLEDVKMIPVSSKHLKVRKTGSSETIRNMQSRLRELLKENVENMTAKCPRLLTNVEVPFTSRILESHSLSSINSRTVEVKQNRQESSESLLKEHSKSISDKFPRVSDSIELPFTSSKHLGITENKTVSTNTISSPNEQYEHLLQKYNQLQEEHKKVISNSKKTIKILSSQLRHYKKQFNNIRYFIKGKFPISKKMMNFLKRFLTDKQIDILLNKQKRVKWTSEEMAVALTLKNYSEKCYLYLKNHLNYSLPSLALLRRWKTKMNIAGIAIKTH